MCLTSKTNDAPLKTVARAFSSISDESTMNALRDHAGFIFDKTCKASLSDAVSSFSITIVATTM